MSTRPLNAPTEPRVYESVGVSTLLSRAWNLLRQNMKESMLVMLAPAVFGAVINIGMSIPAALPTLTSNAAAYSMAALISVGLGFILAIFNGYLWLYCMAILCRRYYQTLIQGVPPTLADCARVIRERAWPLFIVFTLVGLLYMAFMIMDVLFFLAAIVGIYIVIILAIVLMGAAGGSPNSALAGIAAVVAFLVMSALSGIGLVVLISLQGIFCFFPVVAAANARQERGEILASCGHAFRLMFRNFPRALLFGFLLFVLFTTLSLAMSMPIQMWTLFELMFNRVGEPGVIPFHVSVVANIYQILVGTVLWPFIFTALTLLWYDCRVRSDGLDLRLSLYRLNERFKERTGRTARHTSAGESSMGG